MKLFIFYFLFSLLTSVIVSATFPAFLGSEYYRQDNWGNPQSINVANGIVQIGFVFKWIGDDNSAANIGRSAPAQLEILDASGSQLASMRMSYGGGFGASSGSISILSKTFSSGTAAAEGQAVGLWNLTLPSGSYLLYERGGIAIGKGLEAAGISTLVGAAETIIGKPKAAISALPDHLAVGDKSGSVISWNSLNASTVTVNGPGLSSEELSGSQSVSGLSVGIHTYIIKANDGSSEVTAIATLNVSPNVLDLIQFPEQPTALISPKFQTISVLSEATLDLTNTNAATTGTNVVGSDGSTFENPGTRIRVRPPTGTYSYVYRVPGIVRIQWRVAGADQLLIDPPSGPSVDVTTALYYEAQLNGNYTFRAIGGGVTNSVPFTVVLPTASDTASLTVTAGQPGRTINFADSTVEFGDTLGLSSSSNGDGLPIYRVLSGPAAVTAGNAFVPSGVGTALVEVDYPATAGFATGSATATVKITPAAVMAKWPDRNLDGPYAVSPGDQPIWTTSQGATVIGLPQPLLWSRLDDGASGSVDVSGVLLPGTHRMTATFTPPNGNYTAGAASATWRINVPLVVSANAASVTVNSAAIASGTTLRLLPGTSATFAATPFTNFAWGADWDSPAASIWTGSSQLLVSPAAPEFTVVIPAGVGGLSLNATAFQVGPRVTEFTPIAANFTVSDGPAKGRSYPRTWRSGDGWFAYLARDGTTFKVVGSARETAIAAFEIQARAPNRDWSTLILSSPNANQANGPRVLVEKTESTRFGAPDSNKPLLPADATLAGLWQLRARVQDSLGMWSAWSAEQPITLLMPFQSVTKEGRTLPPVADADWFAPSPSRAYEFQVLVP